MQTTFCRRFIAGLSVAILGVFFAPTLHVRAADTFLVKDGRPQAEIIIAAKPRRTTRLAAHELQTYVAKISGAKLGIVTKPSGELPVSVFVGRSSFTDKLGVSDQGLKYGAYRIASGENWLVLIGDDSDFVPIEPWPRNNNDIASGKMQRAWDKITGKRWGYTHSQLHKHYSGSNTLFGTPSEQKVDKDGNVNVWTYDERGSFNAVCAFLRDQGVRWYLPGEIGEIVPRRKSILLPRAPESAKPVVLSSNEFLYDITVRPDFPMRILNFRASVYGRDAMMWGFRLGLRQPFGRQAAHGLDRMTDNEHTLTHHPDWFALYGGKRHTQPGLRLHQLCYSNEELFREAVQFARTQFDHYDMDVVSIMPPDGYTAMCQCKLCGGKDSPELGYRGSLSNYVWEFVNRVAKEVGKTHPSKKISNCAYGVYTAPPSNIDKLEPNVQVIIVGGRRPTSSDRDELRKLREAWAAKTDNPIEIFENYPFTGRGFYLPAYIPRVMGESINATKGMSRGEDIWLTMDFRENAIGYNHFLIYFTARMYWGGKQQDAAAMFDEYCRLFYGPADDEMRTFFRYCEEHWREMEKDGTKANRALELFAAAKATASATSVYGKRIQLIDNYLNGLRNKSVQLAQKRGPVPKLRLVSGSRGQVVVDGKLDDEPWQKCPVASTGRMRELQTGRQPIYGTSIKTAWIGNNLFFAIRCEETVGPAPLLPRQLPSRPKSKPNIATTKNGDQAIWYGDVVEILLDTESHSYYQIAVNPAGASIDLDRGASRNNWFNWSSQAEVATQVADDHWTVEIRIPVTQDKNDPLHQVVGHRPTQSLPWHINVCRQRIRENGSEYSAFSPTGAAGFHKPMKFAHFYAGLSHQFPADATVTDYLISSRAANELLRGRKYEEAMAAYVALAAGNKTPDFQKSDALQHAARCALLLKDYQRADELANQIPIDAVAKTMRMEILTAQRKFESIVDQFGNVDLAKWPFWQIGAGAFARAKAYAVMKAGDMAESDFQTALAYTADPRIRTSILAHMGSNRETNLQDDDGALDAYRCNFESQGSIGAADEFRSVQSAARILRKQGTYDAALATLRKVDIAKLRGYWHGSMLVALGETLTAAGRKDDALAAYREVLADESVSSSDRKTAQAAIKKLSVISPSDTSEAAPIVKVKKEIYVKNTVPKKAPWLFVYPGHGGYREEIHTVWSHDDQVRGYGDSPGDPRRRVSHDNGQTWSPLTPLPSIITFLDKVSVIDWKFCGMYDPASKRLVSLSIHHVRDMRQGPPRMIYNHALVRTSADGGRTFGAAQTLKYENGDDLDAENVLNPTFLQNNTAYPGQSIFRHSNGSLLIPVTNTRIPPNVEDEVIGRTRWPAKGTIGSLCFIGRWNRDSQKYVWKSGRPVWLPRKMAFNGLLEADVAELKDGRVLMVFRVTKNKDQSAYKWVSVSNDAGMTFSKPDVFRYSDGSHFFSGSNFHRLFRSRKTQKLYWIGNIVPVKPANPGHPRYPLVIAEVDEQLLAIKKKTVTEIDTRQPGEGEQLQLSNFWIIENQNTLDLEVYLTRLNEDPDDTFTANAYKYTLSFDE